ncbi:hypothetical protein HC251_21245 [Iamia sp. SCSIO 61187]|uniref:DUF6687 family protein n=1 Tax=Iamia sp. SCSIO 61187 TaxID=2722752 RepID=UPI001C634A59|nr:DUF6687 family protein [Iamia sp. SCSIO 61187]QYG94711.1 hypothetical protein HC251_21245 [Iamia sp. SCSIO 61187]
MPPPTAVPRVHILGSAAPVPPSARTLYVDGSAGASFRPGADLELSRWVPTSTPDRWAADTSTEICVRFLEDPPADAGSYDLAVNNHVDVDGILSVFCLVHPDLALAHRDVVVGAAEVGDLAAGGDRDAFVLAQELTLLMGGFGAPGRDPQEAYEAAFALTRAVLAGTHPETPSVTAGWDLLEAQAARLGREVAVTQVDPRLVAYVLPPLGGDDRTAALHLPPFNAVVDATVWLWPHVRNRAHGQAAHLVSLPVDGGWTHDLWLPTYVWAHTPDRWRPPVLEGTGSSNTWRIRSAPLAEAVAALRADERRPGTWVVADEVDPFAAVPGRAFPVILSFLDDGSRPTPSAHPPAEVATRLAPALASAAQA